MTVKNEEPRPRSKRFKKEPDAVADEAQQVEASAEAVPSNGIAGDENAAEHDGRFWNCRFFRYVARLSFH